jgi:hypothetical protein
MITINKINTDKKALANICEGSTSLNERALNYDNRNIYILFNTICNVNFNSRRTRKMKSKINTWLSHLWKMNKDESDKTLCEIRSFLFQFRSNAEKEYSLIKEQEK